MQHLQEETSARRRGQGSGARRFRYAAARRSEPVAAISAAGHTRRRRSNAAPAVAAQVPPAPIEPPPPSSGNRRGDAFDPSANPNAPGAPRHARHQYGGDRAAATGLRCAGARESVRSVRRSISRRRAPGRRPARLPPPPPSNPSATGAMQATLPPTNSPKDQYDLAYGYVLHKDYALAADTFRGFLRQYPSDRLAPEAQYWLGESLFQQQQYRDAAESFLAVSTKYETTGARAGGVAAARPVARGVGRKGSCLRFARRGAAQISARNVEREAGCGARTEAWPLLTKRCATRKRTRYFVVLKICAGLFSPFPAVRIRPRCS